jgi:CDP-diacylglycerol---serine O-phosphatidyltransferase
MKIRRHIPSIFTFLNLFLGFMAILSIQRGEFVIASYFILIAGVLDSFDGKIARMFGISSDFGTEIDSLADMVSFCLVPSVLIYSLYTKDLPGITGELVASAPLILGAIRLAKFNVAQDFKPTSFFTGFPTPMNAFTIIAIVMFTEQVKDNPALVRYTDQKLILSIIFVTSFLMVSKVKYAKFPLLNIHSGKQNNFRLIGVTSFVISFIIGIFYNVQSWVLIIALSVYILVGLLRRLIGPEVDESETIDSRA